MLEYNLIQRLIAEFIGTTILVATVVGSGIMATNLTADVSLQLLANTFSTGAILFVLISVFEPISGAHFNPTVSIVFVLQRMLPTRHVLPYIFFQISGGVAGTMIAHLMFGMDIIELSTKVRTGSALWFSEFIATFGLVMVILLGLRHSKSTLPALVASYITAAYWFTASTSFANPAVTIARSLTNSFSSISPNNIFAFILAQTSGAFIAMLVIIILLKNNRSKIDFEV